LKLPENLQERFAAYKEQAKTPRRTKDLTESRKPERWPAHNKAASTQSPFDTDPLLADTSRFLGRTPTDLAHNHDDYLNEDGKK
jgi:hypothetical protein